MKSLRRILCQSLKDERGSASVEFVALAIPLFIPIFLYINSFGAMSDSQDSLRTLARESARGFVTSANDQIAYEVANQIFTEGANILGFSNEINQGLIEMQIQCSLHPCISPNASVTVSMIRLSQNSPTIKVSAIEYVSPWA